MRLRPRRSAAQRALGGWRRARTSAAPAWSRRQPPWQPPPPREQAAPRGPSWTSAAGRRRAHPRAWRQRTAAHQPRCQPCRSSAREGRARDTRVSTATPGAAFWAQEGRRDAQRPACRPGRGKPSEHRSRPAALRAATTRSRHAGGRSSAAAAQRGARRPESKRTSAQGDRPAINSMIPLSSGVGSEPALASGGTMTPPGLTLGPGSESAAFSARAAQNASQPSAHAAQSLRREGAAAAAAAHAGRLPRCCRRRGAPQAAARAAGEAAHLALPAAASFSCCPLVWCSWRWDTQTPATGALKRGRPARSPHAWRRGARFGAASLKTPRQCKNNARSAARGRGWRRAGRRRRSRCRRRVGMRWNAVSL